MVNLIPYKIYTDGSVKGNGREATYGGWAYCILRDGNMIRTDSGAEENTTNQRMEMIAIIKALEYIDEIKKPEDECYIYSDSAYIVNCFRDEWYRKWEENGWKTAKRQPVANVDLWIHLINYFKRKNFYFFKVKGHDRDYYNNLVDEVAQKEADKLSAIRRINV